jgi:hypothetical protein
MPEEELRVKLARGMRPTNRLLKEDIRDLGGRRYHVRQSSEALGNTTDYTTIYTTFQEHTFTMVSFYTPHDQSLMQESWDTIVSQIRYSAHPPDTTLAKADAASILITTGDQAKLVTCLLCQGDKGSMIIWTVFPNNPVAGKTQYRFLRPLDHEQFRALQNFVYSDAKMSPWKVADNNQRRDFTRGLSIVIRPKGPATPEKIEYFITPPDNPTALELKDLLGYKEMEQMLKESSR